jgi:hypothetical protein
MRPIRVTVGALGASAPIPLDTYRGPFNVGVGVAVAAGSTLTYTVEHTFDDIYAPTFNAATAVWYSNTGLSAKTASDNGNYAFPVMAVRLNVTAYTSGSATMTVLQAGSPGSS